MLVISCSCFSCVFICCVLDRGREYEVRVAARNSVGYGEEAHLTIKTPEGSESVVYCSVEPSTTRGSYSFLTSYTNIPICILSVLHLSRFHLVFLSS